jgi:diguanylate cyclase
MTLPSEYLTFNTNILKAKVNKYAIYGVLISIVAIIVATVLSSYLEHGNIGIESILKTQKTNMVLWFLDGMPFLFALLGQYMGTMMAYEASALLSDQTFELRNRTNALEQKAMHNATHDELTDLPNRTLFRDRVSQAIRIAKRERGKLAIML